MYAVTEVGGKRYKMQEGDRLRVGRFDAQVGDTVIFDKVLFLGDDDVKVGRLYVEGAKAEVKVLEQNKAKKVVAYRFKAKKNYRNKRGYRRLYTFIEIGTTA